MPRTSVWWRRQRSTPAGLSCNQNAAHSPQYVQSLFGCRAFVDLTYPVNISDVVAQKSTALADHYVADDAAHPQTATVTLGEVSGLFLLPSRVLSSLRR